MQIAPTGGATGTGVSEAKFASSAGQSGSVADARGPLPTDPIQQAGLTDSGAIRELAAADLFKLTQILQPASPPEKVARVNSLMQEAASAINDDRREWAVGRFIEAVTTDPSRVDELLANPQIQPIRSTVEQLLVRLTNVAKMDAETKLGAAERVLENAGWQKLPQWETAPSALIQIAHRLLETGGYPNYVRTGELATILQTAYWGATVIQPEPVGLPAALKKEPADFRRKDYTATPAAKANTSWDKIREKIPYRMQLLWLRAPLFVLLGIWFFAGLIGATITLVIRLIEPSEWIVSVGDTGSKIWSLGFLALVGFGFWARVRKPRP
jgi:hypothetical protein